MTGRRRYGGTDLWPISIEFRVARGRISGIGSGCVGVRIGLGGLIAILGSAVGSGRISRFLAPSCSALKHKIRIEERWLRPRSMRPSWR